MAPDLRSRARLAWVVVAALWVVASCSTAPEDSPAPAKTRAFLDLFQSVYQGLYAIASDAAWQASTDVTPEHDASRVASGKALARAQGDAEVIRTAQRLLAEKERLDPLAARQLDLVLLNAAEYPGTIPDAVARRVEAESRQSSLLDSFTFCLERRGDRCLKPLSANDIDDALGSSRDLAVRLAVWEASKETGPVLKPGLVELRDLRNEMAREMGHASYYALQVADYGMNVAEMQAMLQDWISATRPLYEQLHCYAKHRLAERYGQPVPRLIPAHWIDNRWAQSWGGIVEGVDLDPLFEGRSAEWIVKQAEAFYASMGFPELPPSFWEKSDLYPVPDDSPRKKNTHASAWHVDLAGDVRSLMSVQPNSRWFGTAHHELGHIHYYLAYSRPEVPVLLRGGANRGFHEGIGELISIAALQRPYLEQIGVLPGDREIDRIAWLLNEAFTESIIFIPWSAGTMPFWEEDLYAGGVPPQQWSSRWWDHVQRFQGVSPPGPRSEDSCDACTKTHVNDDPAQYYDYAVATILKYQLHDHISRKILDVDPHEANYYGRKDVGDFLRSILEKGRTVDWRQLLRERTGEDLSARAMLDYFRPVAEYLTRENAGRDCSLE